MSRAKPEIFLVNLYHFPLIILGVWHNIINVLVERDNITQRLTRGTNAMQPTMQKVVGGECFEVLSLLLITCNNNNNSNSNDDIMKKKKY